MKIIYINIAIFIAIKLVAVILMLFNIESSQFLQYLQLPASVPVLIKRGWTLFTYMFVQYDFFHILFNMLWLYWFGVIFNLYFYPKQLLGLYITGGLGGAFLYIAAYNVLPHFEHIAPVSYLIGASASVIAIVVATAMRAPDYKVGLLFLGSVSLKWIAIVTILIDVVSIDSANSGGHIAHIGGALVGLSFALLYRHGIDITKWFNPIGNFLVNTGKRKIKIPKFQTKKRTSSSTSTHTSHSTPKGNMAEMDAILDKIKKSGYKSLSSEEKKRLFEVSKEK